jgi:hypothetical protein
VARFIDAEGVRAVGDGLGEQQHAACGGRLFPGDWHIMTFVRLAAIAALSLSLGACATVIKGGSQSVAITTPPTTGANCTLSDPEGTWNVVSPGVVTVPRSKNNMAVRCTKEGWQDAAGNIPSTFDGWTLGNILIGGVIGVGIDAASGAMNEYPNAFQVPMTKKEGAMKPLRSVPELDRNQTPTS